MCGISGIIHFQGEARREEIERMTQALAHRGPDGGDVYMRGRIAFGHRRLSIIDVSDCATQPMATKDGNHVLTFNGEMYNYKEERAPLEADGVQFRSQSDTEVLLELYARHGAACLPRVKGMFAFGAADFRTKETVLVRDRLGKKPLYWFQSADRLAFASEIKALRLLSDCPRTIDADALRHSLLFGYVPSPYTGIRGIQKLPPGHLLRVRWETGSVEIQPYWTLPKEAPLHLDEAELTRMLDAHISDAVRKRLVSDVPLGAFLSGGIDSSTVVAHMRRHSDDVRTFSIGFQGLRSEIPDALRVVQHLGSGVTAHTKELNADVLGILPTLVRTYDEPFGDPSCIPTYFLCQHAREHVTVALSGDGGDENFGGYARYPIAAFSEPLGRLPGFLRGTIRSVATLGYLLRKNTFTYRSMLFAGSLEKPLPLRLLDYMGNITEDELKGMSKDTHVGDTASSYRFFAEKIEPILQRGGDMLNNAMRMDLYTYLADQLMPKVDLAAMAHGLEVRCPFLDHELVSFALRIPSSYKVRGRQKKLILKRAVSGLLPTETVEKRKQGFRLPMDEWFRGRDREQIRSQLFDAPDSMWQLFDRAAVERFWEGYVSSRVDFSPQIFQLLWVRHWIESLQEA